jgi:hypothetical protein
MVIEKKLRVLLKDTKAAARIIYAKLIKIMKKKK